MKGLLERVEQATGVMGRTEARKIADLSCWQKDSQEYELLVMALMGYIQAVGAALSLVERGLPGWRIVMERNGSDGFVRVFLSPDLNRMEPGERHGALYGDVRSHTTTLPLAILAALLRALIAQDAAAASEAGHG